MQIDIVKNVLYVLLDRTEIYNEKISRAIQNTEKMIEKLKSLRQTPKSEKMCRTPGQKVRGYFFMRERERSAVLAPRTMQYRS